MSFRQKLFRNLLTAGGYNYGTQAIYFLSTIVLSRLLLPAEFGFVTLITVFINFISIFSDAGISHAMIRSDYGKTYQKALMNLTIWIGIGLFTITVFLAYPIAWFYKNLELIPATIVLSLLFIFRSIAIVPTSILNKQLQFAKLGQYTLVLGVVNVIFTITLALLNFSYWAIIIPQVVLALVHYLFLENNVKLGLKIYPVSYVKVAVKKSRSLIGNVTGFNLINYWASNSDALLVGKIYGESDLGLYNRAYSLMVIALNLIGGVFNIVLYPSLKELKTNGGDIYKEYGSILGVISLITLPLGIVLILFPEPLVLLLWGKNWAKVALFLPYFGLLIMSKTLLASNTNFYILMGKEKTNMIIGLVTAVIMVSFIVTGAFISLEYVAVLHAVAFIVFVIPINAYYGFYRTMKFPLRFLMEFWLPKIVLMSALIVTIYLNSKFVSAVLLFLLSIHVIYIQRADLRLISLRLIKR